MSNYTGSQTELLYSYYGAATVSSPTVSPGSSLTLTYPACVIPGNYFTKGGSQSSSLKLKMGGLMTATATIPTWQLFLYLSTSNTFATTLTLQSTATFTPVAGTNAAWILDVDIGLRTLGLGGATTITTMGFLASALLPTAVFGEESLPATGGTPGLLTTLASDTQYYLWPALSLGSATAGNTMTTQYMKLYGEN
jgi:hypothetical protein